MRIRVCGVCKTRLGWESTGVSGHVTSSQRSLAVMDSSTDVKALTCSQWATGEVNVTFRHILADT